MVVQPISTTPQPRATLLLVDDDPLLVEMLASYLAQAGYRVIVAGNIADAITLFQTESPDLLLLDIYLPDGTGYDLYQTLSTFAQTACTPAIFLTELNQREARLKGLSLGAVDFISKPFDLQTLLLRIKNVTAQVARLRKQYHAVTELPTGAELAVQVADWQQQSDWAMLWVQLQGWQQFADQASFIVRDDVLRGVVLLMQNIARPLGNPDILCHLGDDTFLLLTQRWRAALLRPRIQNELENALPMLLPQHNTVALHCQVELFSESQHSGTAWQTLQHHLTQRPSPPTR